MITIKNLSKTYINSDKAITVLRDINCEIKKGEIVSIIGPSGVGKSSLLRCINLLETPTSGSVEIDGVNIQNPNTDIALIRQKVGMVFQQYNLFDHMTVLGNVSFAPIKLKGMSRLDAERQGMDLLRMVGLAEKANYMPCELSGGQKQRVAIARCLSMHPDIILLDEPTSALDPTMVSEVLSVIRKLAKEGLTMIIVTHEMAFARDVSSRILFLYDGIIYEDGTPEQIFEHPQKPITQIFINKIKSIDFDIVSRDYDLYQMNGRIEYFCQKYAITDKINALELLTEEFLTNILPHTGNIHINYNFSEKNYSISAEIIQENCPNPILDNPNVDEISVMLVRGLCDSIEESEENGNRKIFAILKK